MTTGDRRVLMQLGLGDSEVPNIGGFLHARVLGLAQTTPSPFPVWGLDPVSGPTERSALTVFGYGVDLSFVKAPQPAPSTNPVHEAVRTNPAALRQMEEFYTSGRILHPCEGPCDPE